jgi:hypothetical protein
MHRIPDPEHCRGTFTQKLLWVPKRQGEIKKKYRWVRACKIRKIPMKKHGLNERKIKRKKEKEKGEKEHAKQKAYEGEGGGVRQRRGMR